MKEGLLPHDFKSIQKMDSVNGTFVDKHDKTNLPTVLGVWYMRPCPGDETLYT